jgi:hypothetical protein
MKKLTYGILRLIYKKTGSGKQWSINGFGSGTRDSLYSIIPSRVVDPDSYESGSRSGSSLFSQCGSGLNPVLDSDPD